MHNRDQGFNPGHWFQQNTMACARRRDTIGQSLQQTKAYRNRDPPAI